jgi:uncharacterized repeat protein (TIGR01451 family)
MQHVRNAAARGAASPALSVARPRSPGRWLAAAALLLLSAILGWSPAALAQVAAMTVTTSFAGNNDPDGNFAVSAGDNIAYQVAVQNTGTVPLTNVVVDNPLTSPASTTCAVLNPGAFCSLFGGYLVTTADQAAGSITSTGSATSVETGPVTGNTVTTPVITPVAAMTIATTADLGSIDADNNGLVTVGDTFGYRVQMINTGTMPLHGALVDDGVTTTTCALTLFTNQGCGIVATHVVTLADEAAGSFSIVGTATSNEVPGPLTSTLVTPVVTRVTSMTFTKTLIGMTTDADASGTITAGDTLTYTLQMINTGTQNLTNVVVSDPLLTPASLTCPLVNNFSGCGMNGTHVVTAAEAAAGSITNTGTATAAEIATPLTSTVVTPVVAPAAAMAVVVTNNGSTDPDNNGVATVGDTISFQVQVQNTGTVALTNVVVNAPSLAPNTFTCPSVGVGGTCNLLGAYTITVADEAAGSVDIAGSATSAEVPVPVTGTLNTPVVTRTTSLSLSQGVTGNTDPDANGQVSAGDTLTFTLTVLNTGTQPLTAVALGDPALTPNATGCARIDTFAACVLTGTHLVTAAEAAAGSFDSVATATTNELPGPFTDTLATPVLAPVASLGIATTLASYADNDGNGQVTAGDVLTYAVTATNTGAAVLTNVVVSAASIAPGSATCATLAPAQACVLSGTYTVTAADALAGSVSSTGSAIATEIASAVSSTLVTPVATVTGPAATTLTVVSGNQQALATGVPSAPMVVELRAAGVPLAGQVITWSTTGGTLGANSSLTDTAGRASTTVTRTAAGAITVTADYAGTPAYAAASASFQHGSAIASLPGLTPNEAAVAGALDNACAALAVASALTPSQQDLLLQCQALTAAGAVSPPAVARALDQLLPDLAEVQARTGQAAVAAQFENLKARMAALRQGGAGTSGAALTLTGAGGQVPLAGLVAALLGDDAPTGAGAGFSRWGWFASGNVGRGESDPTSLAPRYDFDIEGITVGVDYRASDQLVVGGALGYTAQDTDLAAHGGSIAMHGTTVSAYASWYRRDWYLDGWLGVGGNDYDMVRRIAYTVPLPGGGAAAVDQRARVSTGGSDRSAAFTLGRDFHRDAWAFGVYGRALYTRLAFDAFTEHLQGAQPGSGLGLRVEAREVTALSSVLGSKVDYAHATSWGVLMPHFELEWQHEYRSDPDAFRAFLVDDPTGTPIVVSGDAMDASYLRVGFGLSLVLGHGRSGFVNYTRVVGREGLSQDNLALGLRVEF